MRAKPYVGHLRHVLGVPGLIGAIWGIFQEGQCFGTFKGVRWFEIFEPYSRGVHASFWPFWAYFGGFKA